MNLALLEKSHVSRNVCNFEDQKDAHAALIAKGLAAPLFEASQRRCVPRPLSAPWNCQKLEHDRRCREDIMYRLLFSSTDDDGDNLLSSHVNGLIARANCAEPGILVNMYGENMWSSHFLETLKILQELPSCAMFSGPAHREFRRMIYHAIIFVCLPHVATFTEYMAKNCSDTKKLLYFVEHVLLPAEHAFFYQGSDAVKTLPQWVSFLRLRWVMFLQ